MSEVLGQEIDEKIENARQKLKDGPSSGDLWLDWSNLRSLLYERFNKQNRVADLEEIIERDVSLLIHVRLDGPFNVTAHSSHLRWLGGAYLDYSIWTQGSSHIARSQFFLRLALELAPVSELELREDIHLVLARSLLIGALPKRDRNQIDKALFHTNAALELNPRRVSPRFEREMLTRAVVLCHHYDIRNHRPSLDASIEILEGMVDNGIAEDARDPLLQLATSLSLRYEYSGAPEDLNRAITTGLKTLEELTIAHKNYVTCAILVVNGLVTRYKRYNDISDINRAKDILQPTAFKIQPISNHFVLFIAIFCNLLIISYESTYDMGDLTAGITIAKRGMDTRNVLPDRTAAVKFQLGILLTRRYERLATETDALDALREFQLARKLTPNGWQLQINNNMSTLCKAIFDHTGDLQTLRSSLQYSQLAIKGANVERHPECWVNGAQVCINLYRSDGKRMAYLFQGLRWVHEALSAVPKWRSDHWAGLCAAASSLYDLKYRISNDPEDFNSALVLSLQVWNGIGSPLRTRLQAINCACNLLVQVERREEAWQYLQDAVTLIPLYCASSLSPQDQQFIVSDLPSLTNLACSVGLSKSETDKALEIWESCRGIVVSSSYHAIGELSRLKRENIQLYISFCRHRAEAFEGPVTQNLPSDGPLNPAGNLLGISMLNDPYLDLSRKRREALSSLKKVVIRIRNECKGFANFLRPMTASRMKELAKQGVIVALNASKYQLHAIIVTSQDVKSLELTSPPGMPTYFQENGQLSNVMNDNLTLKSSGSMSQTEKNEALSNALSMVWLYVVKPICESLGFTQERLAQNLALRPADVFGCRIRWLTSGIFSRVPLHAARIGVEPGSEATMSRAISSYAASFRMLDYTLKMSERIQRAELRGLIATMEQPSEGVLGREMGMFIRRAEKQTKHIYDAKTRIAWTTLRRPSAREVQRELAKYPFAYFACHGFADAKDPSKSFLTFVKDAPARAGSDAVQGKTFVSDPLSVTDIFSCTNENAVLAFLVACNTADSRIPALVDESLHIANAFQVTGFPHVIGSLWPAHVRACPHLAKHFYAMLAKLIEHHPLTNETLLLCSHTALSELSVLFADEPRLWAGFVHMGP